MDGLQYVQYQCVLAGPVGGCPDFGTDIYGMFCNIFSINAFRKVPWKPVCDAMSGSSQDSLNTCFFI